jgi:hypothetical protein
MSVGVMGADPLLAAIRQRVCGLCFKRPVGSEVFGADLPRRCEKGCTIFQNLDAMRRVVADADGDPDFDAGMQIPMGVCRGCGLSATAGAYCHQRLNRACPLTVYGDRVARAIEPMVVAHCAAD